MPTLTPNRPTIALLTGLSAVGLLVGCTPAASLEPPDAPEPAKTSQTATAEAPAPAVENPSVYTDGTYSTSASYQSPSGTESIDVTLTITADAVSAVEVIGRGESRDSKRYQAEFIDNIQPLVVGKSIEDLAVDKVAGSSLTSGGFNDAVETIKAEALA